MKIDETSQAVQGAHREARGRSLSTMFSRKDKRQMISADDALPGHDHRVFAVPAQHFVNFNPLEAPFPDGLEQAIFGLGCFWGAERKFWETPGVYTTAVGYAGGYSPNPTYEEVCSGRTGHTEAVLVVYDPRRCRYDETAQGVLGIARPDAGHAAGQRRRHAVPIGDLHVHARAAGRRRVESADVRARSCATRATGRSRRRSTTRRPSTTPRTTTSSTSRRSRTAIADWAAPACRARSG